MANNIKKGSKIKRPFSINLLFGSVNIYYISYQNKVYEFTY